MTATPASILAGARSVRSVSNQRWRHASPTTRTRIQVGVFVTVILVAYHYSLITLLQSLDVDTPLAYVGLVPLMALGLAAVRSRPRAPEPAIYDRQVDYIVGIPLLATALAINLLLPRRLSTLFWVWRIDLLSLPFFVAGVAAIIFGVRALWRQRLAVCFLFLAWPLPYTDLLLSELNAVTTMTLHALSAMVHVVKVATVIPGSGGAIFAVAHQHKTFQLSVVSACSGVNGMVGFLLVGAAFGAIVSGPRLRKSIWLASGLILLWLINLGRLMLIFWSGEHFGEHFAIGVLHPFVGLVTFNIGVVIMLFMVGPAGLSIGGTRILPKQHGGSVVPAGAGRPTIRPSSMAVPSVYSAIAVVVAVGLVLGVNNSGLRAYDLVAQATGEPKLASFLSFPASPPGWGATFAAQYDFAKPYFGESSVWYRYSYSPTVGPTDLQSTLPVIADVINTSDLSSFSSYGVEACYRFHGYSLHGQQQVSLGGGITGQALAYTSTGSNPQNWSIVYWIWPVLDGTSVRYERVILYMLGGTGAKVAAPGVSAGKTDPAQSSENAQLAALRGFLTAFAREVIQGQSKVPLGATLTTERAPLVDPSSPNARLRERALTSPTTVPPAGP